METQERVRFHNVGPSSVAGVIVMSIEDGHAAKPDLPQLDQTWVNTEYYIVSPLHSDPLFFDVFIYKLQPVECAATPAL